MIITTMIITTMSTTVQKTFCLRTTRTLLSLLLLTGVVLGCGRYGPPLAPERFVPSEVRNLIATTAEDSVTLTWSAPLVDVRGEELRSIDGFNVYRVGISESDLLAGTGQEDLNTFVKVGRIETSYVDEREALRAEARARGEVGRKVNVPEEKLSFSFKDDNISTGSLYLYRIIPTNQSGTSGLSKQIVQVVFRGEASEVLLLNPTQSAELGKIRTVESTSF